MTHPPAQTLVMRCFWTVGECGVPGGSHPEAAAVSLSSNIATAGDGAGAWQGASGWGTSGVPDTCQRSWNMGVARGLWGRATPSALQLAESHLS